MLLSLHGHRHCLSPSCQCCRQRLHDNRGLWQEGRLLRLNLEAVLELQLPQRQGADAEDVSADCAICYAYRLPPGDEAAAAAGEEGAGLLGRHLFEG